MLLFVLFIQPDLSFAQSDLATITGTVKDASQASLSGVRVQVTNTGTNATQTTVTDKTGSYHVGGLPIGTYTVSFTKSGFKTLGRKGITLQISQVAEIDPVMQVGITAETIIVTADTSLLQTADTANSTNISAEAVNQLPTNVAGGRSLSKLMFALVPGAEGSDYNSHIDGGVAMTKEVLIDGTSAVSQLGGYISESQPPMEAVREFQADTAGISADAGRSGGGVFRYELKSGTNQIHGSLFGFLHSTDLDALSAQDHLSAVNDPKNAAVHLRKTDSLSDWGGGLGGSILKDKLFYFAGFERYMQSSRGLGSYTNTVPTDAMMGLNSNGSAAQFADLSSLLVTSNPVMYWGTSQQAMDDCGNPVYQGAIVDPATATNGKFGCVFINNQIPTNRISKVTSQILQQYHKYYQPETSGPANNAGPVNNADPWSHSTQSSIKLDYNLSSRQHLAGSFYWNDSPHLVSEGGLWSATDPNGGPLSNSFWHKTTAPGVRLSDAITITPNLSNMAYATFNRFRNSKAAVSQSGKWNQTLGIASGAGNLPVITFSSGMYDTYSPNVNGWYFSSLGNSTNDSYAGNTFIYSDQVQWRHQRNNLKLGAEFRAMQFNNNANGGVIDNLLFDPTATAPNWYDIASWQLVGSSFASFLLGDVYQATGVANDPQYGRRKAFSWYALDEISVNPRLTVTLSVRWDYNSPYKEKYGHWSSFETNDLNPVTEEMGEYEYLADGKHSFERRQDWYNYAPHIGAAFKANEKTVMRGSFGVFFSPLNLNTWGGVPYGQMGNPGYYQRSTESTFNWDNGYQPTVSEVKRPDYTQVGMVSIDPRALTPGNTQQYTLGLQRELDKATMLDLEWIQSHSYHLQSGALLTNQPTVENMQNYVLLNKFPASYVANPYWGYGSPAWAGITPYPQVAASGGPLYSVGSPLGNSDYESLQVSVTRRASHGLSLLASYAWSRTHGDVDSDLQESGTTGSVQNIYDLRDERRNIADFDFTHSVKGFVIYNLPFGRGKMLLGNANAITNGIVGGWSLDGDFQYRTGMPISVHSTNSYPGFNSVYVNLVPGCKLTNGSPRINHTWLNKSCFANPDMGFLGTAGNFLSELRNPGFATEDLSMHKSVAIGPDGRYNFTFRAEFFNVFNRHTLGTPDTNLGDASFGKIISYGNTGGRTGQIGARFTF